MKRKLVIGGIVVAALLVLIATIAIVNAVIGPDKADPFKQTTLEDSSNSTADDTQEPLKTPEDKLDSSVKSDDNTAQNTSLDPETVSTIDIEPMTITVSYVKGMGAFEYEVRRTPNGTNYVEFKSPELVGTKCTNDEGVFVSILEDPSTDSASTISQKTTVDGTTYGLSLASEACTSNTESLAKYQKSFSDAFTLLKKM